MKKTMKLILLLTLILPGPFLIGQGILLEDFENTSCNTGNSCNGYITTACFTGTGGSSHGSPNIDGPFSYCGSGSGSMHLGMNSGDLSGEGFFVDYEFLADGIYEIEFQTFITYGTVAPPAVSPYVLEVIATSGLTHNIDQCSGMPPTVSNSENTTAPIPLAMLSGSDGSCVTTTLTYCPSEDFEQLWIFPTNSGTGGADGLIIQMDDLKVSELCPPFEIFDDPIADIVPGLTQRQLYIETISNSSAYVENDPNQDTELRAGEYILFYPKTFLSAQGNDEFLARILPCGGGCSSNKSLVNFEKNSFQASNFDKGQGRSATGEKQAYKVRLDKIQIAPNPAHDLVSIQIPHTFNSTSQILIYSIDGSLQIRYDEILAGDTARIDVSQFSKGIYLVKIINGATISTEKLIIE